MKKCAGFDEAYSGWFHDFSGEDGYNLPFFIRLDLLRLIQQMPFSKLILSGELMKKLFAVLVVCCALIPTFLKAEDILPPVPTGDDVPALPPAVDLNQITPLPGSAGSLPDQAPPPLAPTKIPTAAPAAKPEAEVATDTPVLSPRVPETPTAEVPEAPKEKAGMPAGTAVPAGALTDYFPDAPGTQWTYAYLKPAEGETEKKTRTVECVGANPMPNGTLRVEMKVKEGGQTTLEKYSLFENKVQHTFSGQEELRDAYAFKLPASGGAAYWTTTDATGAVHSFRSSFGQAQVYRKTYPDCVIVREKVTQGKQQAHTLISYYAKGTGLVAVEFYLPGMKLSQTKSMALVQK